MKIVEEGSTHLFSNLQAVYHVEKYKWKTRRAVKALKNNFLKKIDVYISSQVLNKY